MNRMIIAILLIVATVQPAFAYMGPGAGLTFIGSLVALVSAVLAGIFGFIWFPIKRLLRARRDRQEVDSQEEK